MSNMELRRFRDIDINDNFFDSLKADYKEFEDWFKKKADKKAYVMYKKGKVDGFLYLKMESGCIDDISEEIESDSILKIGTFKINPHGTRLGERFIKKALDYAMTKEVEYAYVTIFSKHDALVDLLQKYGFEEKGYKDTVNGRELVLVKDFTIDHEDIIKNYPKFSTDCNKYILSVYPKYHTELFPDSILNNESYDILKDVTYTNSIHKAYVGSMKDMREFKKGDIIVVYRTTDEEGRAEYRSVATSICVVEDLKHESDFSSFKEFYNYTSKYSIFDEDDLRKYYGRGKCYVVKMTYNAALSKRLIRKSLIEDCGIPRVAYWGVLKINDDALNKIMELGGIDESIIID